MAEAAERLDQLRIASLRQLEEIDRAMEKFGMPMGPPPDPGPMPELPTLVDFFERRFQAVRNHCLQSANRALAAGAPEEAVLACLIHDTGMVLKRPDHGFWAEALYRPYVSERVAFALRYHQSLRFFPAPEYGYEYPELYDALFGPDYEPEPYIQRDYDHARNHEWYGFAMQIVANDDYSFDPKSNPSIDPFVDIIGRHFRQPEEGLGWDDSPSSFMWRTIMDPSRPL